jgi:lipoprotein-releasing system permease protein
MYKLFLCLRYLRSRVIAYFAVIGVALCVAMMLIVVSVMNGFLHKIEKAAKGLFGDIVVEVGTLSGFGWYDEFIADMKAQVPEVESASPFILTYGLLSLPGKDYRQDVMISGVRLPQQAQVTDFAKGLFIQAGTEQPSFDLPRQLILERLGKEMERTNAVRRREEQRYGPGSDKAVRLWDCLTLQEQAIFLLENAERSQQEYQRVRREYEQAREQGDLERAKMLDKEVYKARQNTIEPPEQRIILGLGIPGLSFRTDQGETIRAVVPGYRVRLTMLPMGRKLTMTEISATDREFTVIDDCRTDVSSIDSKSVYVPFETLQKLNEMGAEYEGGDPNGRLIRPARCSMIHVKVREGLGQERDLRRIAQSIDRLWSQCQPRYAKSVQDPNNARYQPAVRTWRERQIHIVSNIEQQRTLVVIMFGIIQLVAVVLIFVIFYMIVFQKTKDIGVLKAIGAGSGGVAQIFLMYGAAVGLVGSVFGTIIGAIFVRNINPIQDWLAEHFGFRVWTREWFLFDKIPNDVDWTAAAWTVVAAIASGLVGAMIPAIRAARMQPVEALRYE